MSQTANNAIIALVNPASLERIPQSAREHATTASCALIEREYPDLYQAAETENPLSDAVKEQLSTIVNQLFEQRMAKHHF